MKKAKTMTKTISIDSETEMYLHVARRMGFTNSSVIRRALKEFMENNFKDQIDNLILKDVLKDE